MRIAFTILTLLHTQEKIVSSWGLFFQLFVYVYIHDAIKNANGYETNYFKACRNYYSYVVPS